MKVCSPQSAGGIVFNCPLGTTGLSGTGFEGHGGTGWLTTKAPVPPGATTLLNYKINRIDQGSEAGVSERGENDIYLIGGDRMWQAQVVEFIPGEPGYSPHWNVHLVKTAADATVADIVASPYVSEHYPEALFDDVEDILDAEVAGLVTITRLGVVVLCPIISEKGAEAPGNNALSEDFPRPWPDTF